MSQSSFATAFAAGRVGENQIARWVIATYGANVIPAYEKAGGDFKGPALQRPEGPLILPDFLAFRGRPFAQHACWIEAKHKTHFTWHYMTGHWQTGIDVRHYEDYLQLDNKPWPVWLLFLHTDSRPLRNHPSMPEQCPTGLFGHTLTHLSTCVHHPHRYYRNTGKAIPMVYWNHEDLHQFATLDMLRALDSERPLYA